MSEVTFDKAKEETYSLFDGRCRQLLSDFLEQKDKRVCSECPESCTQGEKIQKALRNLIGLMLIEAIKECDNNVDIWTCALCPFISTLDFFKEYSKGEPSKSLLDEMGNSLDRLLSIIHSEEKKIELQGH